MRFMCRQLLPAVAMALAGCVADVGPVNTLVPEIVREPREFIPDPGDDGSTVVGLAFSGGGTRAAAFAYGVLRQLDDIVIDEVPATRSLVDDIRMISGVSGGAVTAAYFGYRGRDDYRDFRERFLIRNGEEAMRTAVALPNLARVLTGGVNDRSSFARWLDETVFEGATFADFDWPNAPIVWINASDIFNRTSFVFNDDTFAALCSDLDRTRISDAVAASAAVPVVFRPVVIAATDPDCGYKRPQWLARALEERNVALRLRSYARALDTYQNVDNLNYVKLLDGGLTDNFGVTGFMLERLAATTPHGPLSPAEAVKLDTLLFIVADAGRSEEVSWGEAIDGPTIAPLLGALSDTTISSLARSEFDTLKLLLNEWRHELVRYRCSLRDETVRRHRGTLSGWKCSDVELVLEHLSFSDLDERTRRELSKVPTRLKLPIEQADLVVQAGRDAVRANVEIARVVNKVRLRAGVSAGLTVAADQ